MRWEFNNSKRRLPANSEVVFLKNPTSVACSNNKLSVAIYPVCVEYRSGFDLRKGEIFFISDKLHDLQQVFYFYLLIFYIEKVYFN